MNKRKRWMRRLAALCVLVSLSVGAVPADAAYPPPQGRVNDFANVLDDTTRAALQGIIQDAEQKTTAEIAVATVTSLDGMTVEQFAEGLFREWGIGKKGADNGVLVLVCPSERQMRIEVGYGLEGVLPDGLAGEVIRTHFTPAFREDDYPRGVLQGVGRIAEIVRANHVLTPEELRALEEQEQGRPPAWLMTPFFGLFIALGGAGARRRPPHAVGLPPAVGRVVRRHPDGDVPDSVLQRGAVDPDPAGVHGDRDRLRQGRRLGEERVHRGQRQRFRRQVEVLVWEFLVERQFEFLLLFFVREQLRGRAFGRRWRQRQLVSDAGRLARSRPGQMGSAPAGCWLQRFDRGWPDALPCFRPACVGL